MMTLGKILTKLNTPFKAVRKESSLFIVENAYAGEYDFFAPSPLFEKKGEKKVPAKALPAPKVSPA